MNIFKLDIYEFLTEKALSYFKKHTELDDISIEKLSLGLMIIFLNLFKLSLVLIVTSFLGLLKVSIILMVMISTLRTNAAGVHAKTSLGCTLSTLFIYIISSYLTVKHPIPIIVCFFLMLLSTIILYFYSPADTSNRPIIGEARRKKLKITTVIISIIFTILNIIISNTYLFNITMYSLLFQSISVLPITYKILKQPYNNYELYED